MADLDADPALCASALMKRLKRRLRADELAAFGRLHATRRALEADTYLVHEGDPPTRCAYILDGTLIESKVTRAGDHRIIGVCLKNEFAGLSNMFLDAVDHDIRALTACVLIELNAAQLREFVEHYPDIGGALIADALTATSIAQDWLVNVGAREARARVAHLLCELSLRIEGTSLSDGGSYRLPLTQQQMGDVVGLHRVAVNRVLRSLVEEGIVRQSKNVITLIDTRRLEELADFSARYLHLGRSERDRRATARAAA